MRVNRRGSKLENRHERIGRLWRLAVLYVGVGVVLFGAAEIGAQTTSQVDSDRPAVEISLSKSTRQLLDTQRLTKTAREDPTAAIVALDRLRQEAADQAADLSRAIAEVAIRAGHTKTSAIGAGFFLCAAAETYEVALVQSAVRAALEDPQTGELSELGLQVSAIEGVVHALQQLPAESLAGAIIGIPGPLGDFELRWRETETERWNPATYFFAGATTLERKKKDVEGQRSGLGAPVVAIRRGEIPEQPDFEDYVFPVYKYFYPLTAVMSFGPETTEAPRQAEIRLVDPRQETSVDIGGTEYKLAQDFGAQLVAVRRQIEGRSNIGATRTPGKYMAYIGLYALEPATTERIPLVLVHGLNSSQRTWIEAFEDLVLDTRIRERYQVWAFSYPTGLPFAFSANYLRQALLETLQRLDPEGTNPLLNQTVLVGHSMGGLLVRLQVTDTGMVLWDSVFEKAPDETNLDAETLDLMKAMLIFESLPFVNRVLFFSTPHRGSKQAGNMLGKLGATLVLLPKSLKELSDKVRSQDEEALAGEAAARGKLPDSVQSLQPDYPLIVALDTLPIDSSVTYHSVVGDKGQGDTPDSSDGFVPYWSSHLDGAASERIVPSNHSTQQHPEGIEELQRILHEHLDAVDQTE